MNNFTEGDWWVLDQRELPKYTSDYAVVDEAGWYVASIENCSNKEDEANAILIAKAPRMYKLLERILRFQRENYGDATSTHLGLSIIANDIHKLLEEEDLWESADGITGEDGIASRLGVDLTAQTAAEKDGYQSVHTVEKNTPESTAKNATASVDVVG